MSGMPKRLPDELFRDSGATESTDVRGGADQSARPETNQRLPFRSLNIKEVAPAMVVAGVVGALLVGFGVGKLVALQQVTPSPEVTIGSPTATPSSSPSEERVEPWKGPVRTLPVLAAEGRCQDSISLDPPSNLFDDNPDSVWSCRGAGRGETITFTLEEGEELVGVRLVNGNTISPERYMAERRLLGVKWTFSDGSFAVQGLAAIDRQPQEVRFPPITIAGDVTMTVLDATVPGEAADTNDSVSISSMEFLGIP